MSKGCFMLSSCSLLPLQITERQLSLPNIKKNHFFPATLPPEHQLALTQQLITMGVREGHIAENYSLVGHRQTRLGTDCPGNALYQEINKWPHYDPAPDRTSKSNKNAVRPVPPPDEDNKLQKRLAPSVTQLV